MEIKAKVRTLSEILIDADATDDILKLKALSEELYYNRQHHKLYEVTFGLEHMIDLGKKIQAKNKIEKMLS